MSTEFLYNSIILSNRSVTCGMNVFNCSICNSNLKVASGSPLLSWSGLLAPIVSARGIGVDGLDDVEAEEDLNDDDVD